MNSWLVVLRIYVALAVFQPYRDFEAGDNQSLKFKWRGGESNPGPLDLQAKSLTTQPTPLPLWIVKEHQLSWVNIILVIRSVSDIRRAQSRFVKFMGGEAAGRTPYTFYKPILGPKYVSHKPDNEFITLTTFI